MAARRGGGSSKGPRAIHVTKSPKGGWRVKPTGAKKATVVKRTQKQAEAAAKRQLRNAGGGEVRIHGRDGRIRDSDTVKPGRESPARDTRHQRAPGAMKRVLGHRRAQAPFRPRRSAPSRSYM